MYNYVHWIVNTAVYLTGELCITSEASQLFSISNRPLQLRHFRQAVIPILQMRPATMYQVYVIASLGLYVCLE